MGRKPSINTIEEFFLRENYREILMLFTLLDEKKGLTRKEITYILLREYSYKFRPNENTKEILDELKNRLNQKIGKDKAKLDIDIDLLSKNLGILEDKGLLKKRNRLYRLSPFIRHRIIKTIDSKQINDCYDENILPLENIHLYNIDPELLFEKKEETLKEFNIAYRNLLKTLFEPLRRELIKIWNEIQKSNLDLQQQYILREKMILPFLSPLCFSLKKPDNSDLIFLTPFIFCKLWESITQNQEFLQGTSNYSRESLITEKVDQKLFNEIDNWFLEQDNRIVAEEYNVKCLYLVALSEGVFPSYKKEFENFLTRKYLLQKGKSFSIEMEKFYLRIKKIYDKYLMLRGLVVIVFPSNYPDKKSLKIIGENSSDIIKDSIREYLFLQDFSNIERLLPDIWKCDSENE